MGYTQIPDNPVSPVYQTVQSGKWDDPCTWSTDCDPESIPPTDGTQNNFTIIIHEGHEIELEGDFVFKNNLYLYVCGSLTVKRNLGQDDDVDLQGNGLYLEVCCDAELIVEGNLRLKNIGKLNINGTFVVDGIYGHQANSGNCIYTSIPECGGSISTPDGDPPHIENFLLGEEDDCMSGHTPALPIELLYFKGTTKINYILLEWVTAAEINNNFFTIERSNDMFNWEIVTTMSGAGDSNYNISYEFKDFNPLDSINYYRLKQTDFDGRFEYFNPVAVQWIQNDVKISQINEIINIFAPDYLNYNIRVMSLNGNVLYNDIITTDMVSFRTNENFILINIFNNHTRKTLKYINIFN